VDTTSSNTAPLASKSIQYLFIALYFVAAAYVCWLEDPVHRAVTMDNKIYYFVSERVASGEVPHISLVDHKHALSSLLSGWAIAIGRAVGVEDLLASRIVSIAVASGTVAAVWALSLRLTGTLFGAHISGLVMLTFSSFLIQGTIGMRPKVFMAFFMVLGLLALSDRKPARSGAYGCAAFLCWQPALLVLGAAAAATLFVERRRASVLRMVGGIVAVFLAYEAYFAWHGALGEQLYQSFIMASDTTFKRYPSAWPSLKFVLRPGPAAHRAELVFPLVLLLCLAATLLFAALRPRQLIRELAERSDKCAVLLGAFLATAFTLLDHQGYPDRFFMQPFTALACGVFGAWLVNRVTDGRRPLIRSAVAAACMLAVAVPALPSLKARHPRRQQEAREYLANNVERIIEHYGTLWCIGCMDLLAIRRLPNHSPFGMIIDPRVRSYAMTKAIGSPYQPLEADELPAVILGQRYPERQMLPWLPDLYERLEMTPFKGSRIRVWVRKDAPSAPRWLRSSKAQLAARDRRRESRAQRDPHDSIASMLAAIGYPDCDLQSCDTNGDGRLTTTDVQELVVCGLPSDSTARAACLRERNNTAAN
jgi:hypothetical protein